MTGEAKHVLTHQPAESFSISNRGDRSHVPKLMTGRATEIWDMTVNKSHLLPLDSSTFVAPLLLCANILGLLCCTHAVGLLGARISIGYSTMYNRKTFSSRWLAAAKLSHRDFPTIDRRLATSLLPLGSPSMLSRSKDLPAHACSSYADSVNLGTGILRTHPVRSSEWWTL